MAQNLNYQTAMTYQQNSASPSTATGSNPDLIGHFWCPGANGATSSSTASCEVWGALYSWETAMSFNGLGGWSDFSTSSYCRSAASTTNCKLNWGRKSSGSGSEGRGICPENWHVPTDFEWGVILDGMEESASTAHQNASGVDWYGYNAGSRAKSSCTCGNGKECYADTIAYWGYTTSCKDTYGFRIVPAGCRFCTSQAYSGRGESAYLWSSTAESDVAAQYRRFDRSVYKVGRLYYGRRFGLSVRCVQD
jgi:uncharacterized protein (TIGR02145 family)